MEGRVELPPNTVIGESYRIDRVIGSGGFGITYAAEDIDLGTQVAIKEYYPEEFGARDAGMRVRAKSQRQKETFEWGRSSFLEEARTLARFRHPSVVRVSRVFQEYSTAYMVMDFERGQDFEAWLRQLGRSPSQEELDRIARPLLDALELIHAANFLHRDIAPDNVIVRPDGTPVLLDFGAARRAVAERSRTLTGIVKAGYSPFEQYSVDGRLQGPWSDLYAFGGTLYRAVSGTPPDEATLRMVEDRMRSAAKAASGTYRPGFLAAIDACLAPRHSDRPQSVAQLRQLLFGDGSRPERERRQIAETNTSEQPRSEPRTFAVRAGAWRPLVTQKTDKREQTEIGREARAPDVPVPGRSVWQRVVQVLVLIMLVGVVVGAAYFVNSSSYYAAGIVDAGAARFVLAKRTAHEGVESGSLSTLGGVQACATICSVNDCKGFTYSSSSCRLFSRIDRSVTDTSSTSGTRVLP